MRSFDYRSLDTALPRLAGLLDRDGWDLDSRAGKTKEVSFVNFTIREPLEREILHPDRKASIAAQIAETMWVLAGRNDVEWLSNYLPRASEFSDDGRTWRGGYGPRIRAWKFHNEAYVGDTPVDQLAHVVELLKSDPETRRAVISIYDPAVDVNPGKDIPCNNWLSFLGRAGRLDLHVATRSNDLIWGWSGINQFEWSTLLEVVAGLTGFEVGSIHYSISSLHSYERHFDKLDRLSRHQQPEYLWEPSPRFGLDSANTIDHFDNLLAEWFRIEEMIREDGAMSAHPDLENLPEPMLRNYLRVLQWWWSGGDKSFLVPLEETRLYRACEVGVQPKPIVRQVPTPQTRPEKTWAELAAGPLFPRRPSVETISEPTPFLDHVVALHTEKHKAYGDSWKRRGEFVGILANIARKVDRLGGSETADETSADTAIDLFVYLAKYRWWLWEQESRIDDWLSPLQIPPTTDDLEASNRILRKTAGRGKTMARGIGSKYVLETTISDLFGVLEREAEAKNPDRHVVVDSMLEYAYELAQRLWHAEKNRTRSWNPEPEDDSDLPL